jgi:alcohol dehydrogenase, propanol-preferring
MLAVRLSAWRSHAVLDEVPRPEPGPGEILLDVEAAGLCHTDLHLMEWPPGTLPYNLPFTLGHEVAGVVRRLGSGASSVEEGDRVLVYSRWGCGVCWQCLRGWENICERPVEAVRYHGAGLGRDGGLAEQIVVPSARYLLPIGDLDAGLAAPLSDAGLTPYHAIARHRDKLRPNATAVVIGVGGLGHMAVQMLRALSAVRVIAVDLRDEALEVARRAGAHAVIPATGLTADALRAEVGKVGAALILDCVATDETLALSAATVGSGGAIVYLGRGGGNLGVAASSIAFDSSVTVSSWGTIPELVEVVALARAGAIHTETTRYSLTETVAAYNDLANGRVVGRAVASLTSSD